MRRFWPAGLVVALLAFVVAPSTHLPAAEPKGGTGGGKSSPLDNLATVKWENISLEDVATDLREKHKLDVTVDRQSIENEGLVTTNIKINMNFRGLTLRSIIWLALDGYRLELVEKPDGPLITSRPVAEDTYLEAEYDLKPLGVAGKDPKALVDLVRGSVDAYWKDTDSFGGAIAADSGKLTVSQTPAAQAQVASLIRQITRELASGKKPMPTTTERNEKSIADQIAKTPLKKLSVTGEIPFNELAGKLGESLSVPVWVDGAGLDDVRVGFKQPITPQITGKTGVEILDSILEPLELGYVIDHEVVLVTSKLKANKADRLGVFNTRAKGVKLKGTPEEIARTLQESDEYGLWGDGGGAINVLGPLVVIRQSPKALKKIEAVLRP